jgi:hypothetical protein
MIVRPDGRHQGEGQRRDDDVDRLRVRGVLDREPQTAPVAASAPIR